MASPRTDDRATRREIMTHRMDDGNSPAVHGTMAHYATFMCRMVLHGAPWGTPLIS